MHAELAACPGAGNSLLLLVDDNMYYRQVQHVLCLLPEVLKACDFSNPRRHLLPCRSMRYEMAQMARHHNAAYVVVYLSCSLVHSLVLKLLLSWLCLLCVVFRPGTIIPIPPSRPSKCSLLWVASTGGGAGEEPAAALKRAGT